MSSNSQFAQTRDEAGALRYFPTLKMAMDFAEKDQSVWKISFVTQTGESVRMVRHGNSWLYSPILTK